MYNHYNAKQTELTPTFLLISVKLQHIYTYTPVLTSVKHKSVMFWSAFPLQEFPYENESKAKAL